MIDGRGRVIEVILLRPRDGARPWIRVIWHHRILLGRGYYRQHELDETLALIDIASLVEVIELRLLAAR